MKLETYEQRVLTAENGKFLCKKIDKKIVDKTYLAKEEDASNWVEITQEEKESLESKWESETLPESQTTEQDYQNALEEMGVKFDD